MTTLTRWEPFSDFSDLHARLDRLFERVTNGDRAHAPAIDVIRKEGSITVRADMPGMRADDVKIEIEHDVLTISGEHEERAEEKKEHYVRRERSYGSFYRSLSLPSGVDPDAIEASCRDGVLEVTVPLPKGKQKKAVEIKPAG